MYPGSKRLQAITLRKKGASLNKIISDLKISKGTAHLWVKDVRLSAAQKHQLREASKNAGRLAFIQTAKNKHAQHEKRIRIARKEGKRSLGSLSYRDVFMLGLGLYWGEGYKKGSRELGFTNMDKKIITFFIHWLEKCFTVSQERLILRVSINQMHRKREGKILQYWSKTTGIPVSQFTKTSFVKSKQKKIYADSSEHYGTLRIKVSGGSILREKILASLARVQIKSNS